MAAILKTQSQTFALAKGAGFSDKDAEVMAAIAMAETFTLSNGNPFCDFGAVGDLHLVDKTYGPSYGAWQVRSVKAQAGTKNYRDPIELAKHDPVFNAKAARSVFLAQGFKAWSTYLSGAYKGYMLEAKYNPVPEKPSGSYIVTGGDTLSGIGNKTGFVWRDIASLNKIAAPKYVIYPGNIILLPEFDYKVQSGNTLTWIAANIAKDQTWYDIWQHNITTLPNPNNLSVGQVLKIPRRVS